MGKIRRRKILMWIFGIILCISGSGAIITLVLSNNLVRDPKEEFPPEMFLFSTLAVVFVISCSVLIMLVLTMKNRL